MYLIAKSVSKWYPELFLIVSVIVYWAQSGTIVNPIAIALFALLVAQLRFKNKIFGIVLSVIFMLLCLYMMLAIFSDLVNLETFYPNGWLMIAFGVAFFGTTAFFALALLKKNSTTISDQLPIGND
ncbi:MAG: 4-amino-4-deoxy-L-arabinose transferase-like glycosyltransferase [Patiriisocius sp.]|jgi:4-amino-4-deoxy-L-arabinose transferase-like glycosyltransferase